MKKVLICEDDEGIRESLKLILADYYELILTDNPDQSFEVLKNAGTEVGIVFFNIKVKNGVDLLKKIKEHFPHLNIIAISGYKSLEHATEAVRYGASGYILKPFKADEILALVRKNLK